MATVESLTKNKILELASQWASVISNQESSDVLLSGLLTFLEQNSTLIELLNVQTLPQLQEQLAANDEALSDLNATVIPDLQAALAQNDLELLNLTTVTIPDIVTQLTSSIEGSIEKPKVYVQAEAPTNPDDDDRYLVVGDVWFDSDDNNRQKVWNGVEWSTFGIDIPNFSITVQQLFSSQHLIY